MMTRKGDIKGIDTEYAKKVLIVDDEPYILRVLKLKLENAGYEVLTAVNGTDGLEKFVRSKPAVVVTDINMPHMDGLELCKMMNQHKRNPFLVIITTSSVDNAIKTWTKTVPNVLFLEKPFSPKNILNLINQFFSTLQEFNADP
jgi:two-component system alkaline phosphatase synthesis response regulator PhoP